MTRGKQDGIWKSAKGRGRSAPKGRQLSDDALADIRLLLGPGPRRRDLLIEFLHVIQDKYGALSAAHLRALAEEMNISQAEVYEVATFYAHFDVVKEGDSPPPAVTIRVCDSLSCSLAGAEALKQAIEGGVDPLAVRVLRAPCMGLCDQAPAVGIGHRHVGNATAEGILNDLTSGQMEEEKTPYLTLAGYQNLGGYDVLLAMRNNEVSVSAIQKSVETSGLRGMGGAGFPTSRKWSFVRGYEGPRYLAVNADEGEPGTFKDKHFLETAPHIFLEGTLIAAQVIEAEKCFIYIRDEYPAAREILAYEVRLLEDSGLISAGYIDIRRGAGAYICGEESAMIESIEGKRGLPRLRPPYVAEVGVFSRPTLVHNVETLYWVARICREGPQVFADHGVNGRKGMRSYSVSGRVKNPGIRIAPAGQTVRDLIALSGGMLEGHEFRAYQPGGPSSGLLPATMGDVPLDFDTLQDYGSFIGSAAVVILSDHDSPREAALNMLRFFQDESCGQCTPCRSGCEKAVALMQANQWDQALLGELCDAMSDASICGLGQAAPNPIRSIMKYFDYEIT